LVPHEGSCDTWFVAVYLHLLSDDVNVPAIMGELLGVVDVAALRSADRGSIEIYIEAAFKYIGASNRRYGFRLIDTDHEGPLLDRLQHLGCREQLSALRKQNGPQYVPGVASKMRTIYNLIGSNALKVLLAAKESTGGRSWAIVHSSRRHLGLATVFIIYCLLYCAYAGQSKLCNVSQAISTDMLQLLVANAKDEDKGPPCVALLLRLPKTAESVAAFMQEPVAGKLWSGAAAMSCT
jgi:hypothetical protein